MPHSMQLYTTVAKLHDPPVQCPAQTGSSEISFDIAQGVA